MCNIQRPASFSAQVIFSSTSDFCLSTDKKLQKNHWQINRGHLPWYCFLWYHYPSPLKQGDAACSDLSPLLGGLQRSRDLEAHPVSGQRRWDERGEPAEVPAEAQHVTQVTKDPQVVGPARREPLPCGLTAEQQEEMEEEESGHQQETHHARVGDEGESEGAC